MCGGSGVLNDGEDVAFAVLEPRRLRAAGFDDAARALLARHVVVLELDPARLQPGHLALDIIDLPERLARQRGAGVWCRVEEACGLFAKLVDQDRKSTRLNSSHITISYAVFCL